MNDYGELLTHLLGWLDECTFTPVPLEFVEGTTPDQRSALAGLGALLAQVVMATNGSIPDKWPEEVRSWLSPDDAATNIAPMLADAIAAGVPILEEVYTAIVTPSHRRRLGTFFTPHSVVEDSLALADTLSRTPPEVVIDPGAGVGAYSMAVADHWPNADIVAVDINVVTLGMFGVATYLQNLEQTQLSLLRADYLQMQLDSVAQEGSSLVLGNPPYTRHQELDSTTKDLAQQSAGDLVPSRSAGLSTYFLAHTIHQMRPHDYVVLLLPANWMHCNYGQELRAHLWNQSRRRVEVHTFPPETMIFPDARIGAMLLGIGPKGTSVQELRFCTRVVDSPVIVGNRSNPTPSDWRALSRVSLDDNTEHRLPLTLPVSQVRRGVATGANDFFLISDKQATLLPSSVLVPVVPRLTSLRTELIDDQTLNAAGDSGAVRWLFSASDEDLADERVKSYVATGVAQGKDAGFLTSQRETWFDLRAELKTAPILIGPMARSRFSILVNKGAAYYTNSLFGITPDDQSDVNELLAWLRSDDGQAALRSIARPLGAGLLKLEPGALGRLLAHPDTRNAYADA